MAKINNQSIEAIKAANCIVKVVRHFQQTAEAREGKDFKTLSDPKLILNTNKFTALDYQNSKGYTPISYLMEFQNFEYIDALKFVADTAGIVVLYDTPEETKTALKKKFTKAKPKKVKASTKIIERKNNGKSYRDNSLAESGLTNEDQKFKVKRFDKNGQEVYHEIDIYSKGTVKNYDFANPDFGGDDLIIKYIKLDGTELLVRKHFKGVAKGPEFPFIRIRHENPNLHLDKSGKPKKYESPGGTGTHLYFPSALIRAYQNAKQFDTLYIQEGEKKADKATKHGLYSVGIGGITSIAANGILPQEFEVIIKKCGVKNVVFLVDADFQDLGNSETAPVNQRPMSFYYAVKNYRSYFYEFTNTGIFLNIYFGYITNPNTKGIDDLLVTKPGSETEIVTDIKKTLNKKSGVGSFVNIHNITVINPAALLDYFHLQTQESFFAHHREALKQRQFFKYKRQKFRFNPDTNDFELNQPLRQEEQFFIEQIKEVKGKEVVSLKFDFVGLNTFLQNRGFHRYWLTKEQRIHIQLGTDRIIREVDTESIKDYVLDFTTENIKTTETTTTRDLLNFLYAGQNRYLGDAQLSNLTFAKPQLHQNTTTTQYYYFNENYIEITPNGIKEIDYKQLSGYVWEDRIINRNFSLLEPYFDVELVENEDPFIAINHHAMECEFMQFLYNTSNFYHRKKDLTEDEQEEITNHLINKLTGIGYLLHTYYNPTVTKIIFGIDGKNSEIGESHGRTGKGLTGDAICEILPHVVIDGKDFEGDDKFAWEEVTERTPFIKFDDPHHSLSIDKFYSRIIGNFKVNAKGKSKFTISKENTPKIYIPTNHAPKVRTSSDKARAFQMAYSDYYNENRQPNSPSEFGHRFFDEWTETQYNQFLNTMFYAVQLYLKIGLKEAPSADLEIRQLRSIMGTQFELWAEKYFHEEIFDPTSATPRTRIDQKIERSEMFADYKTLVGKYAGTPQSFKTRILAFCDYHGYIFNPHKPITDPHTKLTIKPTGGRDVSGGVESFTISKPIEA